MSSREEGTDLELGVRTRLLRSNDADEPTGQDGGIRLDRQHVRGALEQYRLPGRTVVAPTVVDDRRALLEPMGYSFQSA
jgi:hypothetical protein